MHSHRKRTTPVQKITSSKNNENKRFEFEIPAIKELLVEVIRCFAEDEESAVQNKL